MQEMTLTKSNKEAKKGFRIQVEYCPNPEMVIVHCAKRMPKSETDSLMNLGKKTTKGNNHPLIKAIRRLHGVVRVSSESFELTMEKGKVFEWKTILPKVRTAIRKHLADGEGLSELDPKIPSPDYLASLRASGSDI